MDIQSVFEMLSNAARDERKIYHLTLGQLVDVLDQSPDATINLGNPHSYRGYYDDLAFSEESQIAGDLSRLIKSDVMDKTLKGYKGGDFLMDENTPLWLASYGDTGLAIVGAEIQGDEIKIFTKNVD